MKCTICMEAEASLVNPYGPEVYCTKCYEGIQLYWATISPFDGTRLEDYE